MTRRARAEGAAPDGDLEYHGWREWDIPALAAIPVAPELRQGRLEQVVTAAHHEAGHIVVAATFSIGIAGVRVRGEYMYGGRSAGRTWRDEDDLREAGPDRRRELLVLLAGNVVARMRHEEESIEGFLEAGSDYAILRAEAEGIVESNWDRILAVAAAVLRSPDLSLVPARDPIVDTPRQLLRRGRMQEKGASGHD